MKPNLSALSRRDLIRLTLDVGVVTTRMPCHMVELADFPAWVELVGARHVLVRLRADGRVDATAGEFYRDQYVTVHTTADLVRDMELPPFDPECEWRSTKVDVGELWRLESLRAVAS